MSIGLGHLSGMEQTTDIGRALERRLKRLRPVEATRELRSSTGVQERLRTMQQGSFVQGNERSMH